MATSSPVRVLCIGGSTRPNSSSEKAVKVSAAAAEAGGAVVDLMVSRDLMFPIYDTETADRTAEAERFVKAARAADALIIASPGYHGSMSGMLKNVLDYLEDTNKDERVYLDGVPVGCIAVSYGWQATVSTLQSIRTTVHALRGWPSPFGATINATEPIFDADGACIDDRARFGLETVAKQVVEFAQLRKAGLLPDVSGGSV
ncbi:NADPH-dependent FMN reductase [Sporichthya sp.]|uniref:NADPH-dependent FMN reductase n=1 Tax=Sporichthya sp. TaxID=65475 RepID=UPI0018493BF8|nr:NADPH-dependent FMN reductase [Sporichthya sp.]MBA3742993.1 NAD(P)H-dependent oxidoreductase [Sporichthya sp.]